MDLTKYHNAFSHKTKSDIGVLVIHGITSTTSSMQFLADKFAAAGFNVELPGLTGHGTRWQDMTKIKYQDWIYDLENALERLQQRCSIIFLCGLSLGGGLALYIAGNHPELKGLILINHAAKFTGPKFWFVPILKLLVKSVPAIASDIKDPNSKEMAYERTPTNGVNEMLKMLKSTRRMLPNIKLPTIIFKSKEDHVVPKISVTYTLKNLGSAKKELIWLNNSYHVAPLDNDKEFLAEKSIEFINDHV